MSCGKLSFESPPFLYVKWKIPAFFQLGKCSLDSLRSPEFPFADGRYCLELFPSIEDPDDEFVIKLSNFTYTRSGTNVSCDIGLKSITGTEIDLDLCDEDSSRSEFYISQSELEDKTHLYFPDGTLTVFCSLRLRKSELGVSLVRRETKIFGELSFESPPFVHVTWKIPVNLQLLKQSGYYRESPKFLFCGGRYFLRLVPSSESDGNCVIIELVNLTDTVPGTAVSYEVWFKSRTGEEIDMNRIITTPRQWSLPFGEVRSLGEVSFYVPSYHQPKIKDNLTVFCSVRLREPSSAGRPKSSQAETSDEEQEQDVLPGVAKLLSDYRQLLKKGAESDACLVVNGKEFRAHKNILRARSPIFEAMFDHETAEKNSGRVVIDDLDPESFGDFLEYLYTGGLEAGLSDDNAFGLYAAADKYDVPTLKSECLAHMLRNMSVDSFSDVVTLALRHQEEKLLKIAVTFFKENMARIIVTVKWQQFVIDNGTSANELLIKAVVPEGQ